MRYGYWLPVFGGWLRNVENENMQATWSYVKQLAQRSEAIGFDLTLIAELNLNDIKGMEAPHGIVVAPNGSRIYISDQADNVVTVIDGKSLQVTKRIPLSGNPNLVDITPDGRWIYVGIVQTYDDYSEFPLIKANPSGGVDVIDTVSFEKVKTIPFRGGA